MKPRDPSAWSATFRDAAGADPEDLVKLVQGTTRVDPYLQRSLEITSPIPESEPVKPDEKLWRCVVERDRSPLYLVRPEGRLFDAGAWSAIEVATEAELCGLHALAHAAIGDETVLARCINAAQWLMDEIQPDNATNRPWACGFFVWLWCSAGTPEALHYAEGQLHAAIIGAGTGASDARSGLILHDAANWLERIAQAG